MSLTRRDFLATFGAAGLGLAAGARVPDHRVVPHDARAAERRQARQRPARLLLTYLTSFNEWHEGHQFEPMKDRTALTPEELAIGYHNPDTGTYRLATLRSLLAGVLA